MEQLIMRWANDGEKIPSLQLPQNCQVKNFSELENAMDAWLEIVQYGLTDGKKDEKFYHATMTIHSAYQEDKCFFVLENGIPVATLTVICDYTKSEGYIHMVACHEAARGKGYGTLLNQIAVAVLKKEGMSTAYLTTDDWRIPAIKSYLRAGFIPDLSTDDFQNRWASILAQIGM